MPLNIAILASGNGTNAQVIMDKAGAGILDVDVRLVLSNRPGAGVLERAHRAGVPSVVIDHSLYPDRAAHERAVVEAVAASGARVVVLAGYMRLLTGQILSAFPGRILNIHPALLPSFPGTHGGADALAYGVKLTGCSVHFVDEQMDTGPLIIQAAVPVMDGDTLETLMPRIHALEHRIYPQALQWLAQGRLRVEGRQVHLAPDARETVRPTADGPDGDWFVWPPLEKGF